MSLGVRFTQHRLFVKCADKHVFSISVPSLSGQVRSRKESIFPSDTLNHHVPPHLWYYSVSEIDAGAD